MSTAVFSFDFTGVAPAEPEAPKPAFALSPQQETIMDWVQHGEGNGMIVAVAGAGKTTTLIEALARMTGKVAFAAYNKRIADEIGEKVRNKGLASGVSVKTFHAFGFAAWRRKAPRVRVDGDKLFNLIESDVSTMPRHFRPFAMKLVSMLRQSGIGYVFKGDDGAEWDRIIYHYGIDELLSDKKPWEGRWRCGSCDWSFDMRGPDMMPECPRCGEIDKVEDEDEDLTDMIEIGKVWAGKLLNLSIQKSTEVIDFDDQIFMPLYSGMELEQYDWVLVDEAQDTNPARLAQARAMLKPGGRLLAVGDPQQAIFGFAGADSSSLPNIIKNFSCAELDLTVCYRCPQAVVRHAQQWSEHIEAAETAPEGFVGEMDYRAFVADFHNQDQEDWGRSVILCRNNKPVVALAFELIRQRIPCHVEGRDIGGQIKELANKWKVTDLESLRSRVQGWRNKQVEKWMRLRKESRADQISDRAETLLAFIDGVQAENPRATVYDLNRSIDALFADNSKAGVTLSSIHKSKGREWHTVYWLGRNAYQPSRFAKQEWQVQQESNLMYVAATRAMVELIEVNVLV